MTLDIVIPTKNRKEKLDNCLNTLFHSVKNHSVDIYIYFSINEEFDYYNKLFSNIDNIKLILINKYKVPDFWNNHLNYMKSDAMCYINDDILFFDDTLDIIFEKFYNAFPDYDGVMGLRQDNIPQDQAVEGAFGVIGKKYVDRFPNGQVWCPDYNRLHADFELWRYAKSIDRFYFCTLARIEHMHPAFSNYKEDDTHRDVRKWKQVDRMTFNKRKSLDLLWGESFELINKE